MNFYPTTRRHISDAAHFVITSARFWTLTKIKCLSILDPYLHLKFGCILFSKLRCIFHFFQPNFHLNERKYANKVTMLFVPVYICPLSNVTPVEAILNTILFNILISGRRSRDSSVGMDEWGVGFRVPIGSRIFSSPCLQTDSRAHPVSYPLVPGTLSSGVKRQGREADHSLPTSAEMKKMWIYTYTPSFIFMA
jgi:hypothetical protein